MIIFWMNKIVHVLIKAIGLLIQVFLKAGGWILAAMAVLIGVEVIMRNMFKQSITGSFDIIEYMMAIIITSGIAYCALVKGHINADILLKRLPEPKQAIINSITGFLSFGLMCLVTWQTFKHMSTVYDSKITSGVLYIPQFPFIGVVGFGFVLLTIILLKDWIELLLRWRRK